MRISTTLKDRNTALNMYNVHGSHGNATLEGRHTRLTYYRVQLCYSLFDLLSTI